MTTLGRLLEYFVAPAAIGFYLTILLTTAAWTYYYYRESDDKNIALKTLEEIHLKTIDLRMQIRGPRPGSSRVAILDIDDRSVLEVGRWPWPRAATAKVVENIMKYEPAVLSFDIIFSEAQQNPVRDSLDKLRASINIDSPEIHEFIENEIQDQNQDSKLSEVIAKYGERMVLESFFEKSEEMVGLPNFVEKCFSAAYSLTRWYEVFENEDAPPIIVMEGDYDLPDPFFDKLTELLEERKESDLETYLEKNQISSLEAMSQADKDQFEDKFYIDSAIYCASEFLSDSDPNKEELASIWEEVIGDDEDFEGLSYEDGVKKIRARGKKNRIIPARKYVLNIPLLADETKHNGFFVAEQDSDGMIRRAHLVSRIGANTETYLLPISLKAYLVAENKGLEIIMRSDVIDERFNRVTSMSVIDDEGNREFDIPVDSKGNMRINYAGERQMFAYISAAEFINDSEYATISQRKFNEKTQKWEIEYDIKVKKADFVKDKLFLFGPSATGIMDLRVTPFEKNYPGVETHANVLDNILRQDFLKNYPNELAHMIFLLLGLGIVLSGAIGTLSALPGLLITGLSIVGILAADYFLYFTNGIVTTVFFPISLISLLYVGLTFYKYLTEERKKRELKGTFSKYVSPSIVEEILKDPGNIELGGKKQNITVFFSDVRGFTTFSERLDPQQLSDLLNAYLTPMTELVFEHKGTIDKYMGDAIMAFFGAPIGYDDHAKFACRCALSHLEKLDDLNREFLEKGWDTIDIGIGLNTGECSVGNMGSNTIRNYTVMGDSVNLGSRLEGITKQYGVRTVISEFTYKYVKDDFACREIDWVKVKGKLEPVKIYELVAEGIPKEEAKQKLLENFNKGFDLYHQKQFEQAIAEFESGLTHVPDDFCSKLYIDRCKEFVTSPPPEDWDGVFTMTTK